MIAWLLLLPTTTLTLDQAVERVMATAAATDGPEALRIEASRIEDAHLEFDDVRLRLEHRNVDHFVTPRLGSDGQTLDTFDNTAIGATITVPRLDTLVRRSSAAFRAQASQAALAENARDSSRGVRRAVVQIAALKRERAFLDDAIRLAQQREDLLSARRVEGTSTILMVDAAVRDRLSLLADALGVDDLLQSARADLAALLDSDDDVDDDIELRCQQGLPSLDAALATAHAHDPRQAKLQLLDDALAREQLASWLGWVPWPDSVQGTYIRREPGQLDDVRLQLDVDLPLFRLFDDDHDALALRRLANDKERALVDNRLTREVREAMDAVVERKRMAALLAPPPPLTITPEDPAEAAELALNRNLAERRRLRAIARCARAVVDVLSLTAG